MGGQASWPSSRMGCGGPTRLLRSSRQLISALEDGLALAKKLHNMHVAVGDSRVCRPRPLAHTPGLPRSATSAHASRGKHWLLHMHAVGSKGGDFCLMSSVRCSLAPVLPHPRARHARL